MIGAVRTARKLCVGGGGIVAAVFMFLLIPGLVLLQVFLFIRFILPFFVPLYGVPSSAMEPTLMGPVRQGHGMDCPFAYRHRPPTGDHILVSKIAYWTGPVNRYDLVVFRFPLNPSESFVKRVVGLPGEELVMHRGDLYVRAPGEEKFRIARKPPAVQEKIWIEAWNEDASRFLASQESFDRSWKGPAAGHRVRNGELVTGEGETRFLLDLPGWEFHGGDRRLAFAFEGATAIAEIENDSGTFAVEVVSDGSGALRFLPSGGSGPLERSFGAMPSAGRKQLDFWVVDGRASVRLNGKVRAELVFRDLLGEGIPGRKRETRMKFGSRGSVRFRDLAAGRDLHYARSPSNRPDSLGEDQRIAVPEGSYLMFGDNVERSHDSRAWVRNVYDLKDGSRIECEGQQVVSSLLRIKQITEAEGLDRPPDVVINADSTGRRRFLYREDLARESREPFRFIERKFLTGKVVKIWWPPARADAVR